MKACKECGQLYDDDATYCNRCQLDLNDHSTDHVIDQTQLEKEVQQRQKHAAFLFKCIMAIAIIVPFILGVNLFSVFTSFTGKLAYVGLVECLCFACFWLYKNKKQAYFGVAAFLGLLILLLFPIGLLVSGLMFYLIILSKTR